MSKSLENPNRHNDAEPGNRDLQQIVDKAMQDLDEARRTIAASAQPSAKSVFARRAALALAVVVSIAGWVYAFGYWVHTSASRLEPPNEVAARDVVEAIVSAEDTFRDRCYSDANGDGIADYGKLHQLADPSGAGSGPALVDVELADSEAHGYVITVLTRESAPSRGPIFRVIASPLITTGSARVIVADESGSVRTLENGQGLRLHDIAAE